jgi:rhamnosyltransferase
MRVTSAGSSPPARHVLCVEYQVPRPANDAGSLRLLEILKILRDAGHAVTLFTPEIDPPSELMSPFEAAGIAVIAGKPLSTLAGQDVDLVLLSREGNGHLLPLLRAAFPGAPVIFDTVDLSHVRVARQARLERSRAMSVRALELKGREIELARSCQLTWVVSEDERRWLRREDPRLPVEVVSLIYDELPDDAGFGDRGGLLFLGGLAHPPNRDAIELVATRILPRVRSMLGPVPMTVVGAIDADTAARLEASGITATGRVDDVAPYLRAARVFVAPLRYGAGVKGKILHAMSAGLPVVTTSVGAEGIDLTDGDTAVVADDPDVFAERTAALYTDTALWERLSRQGRAHLRARFSAAAARRRIDADLVGLLSERPAAAAPAPAPPPVPAAPAPAEPLVSIVIPVKDGGAVLDRTLGAVFTQSAPFPFEVVVVDSGSGRATLDVLARHPVRVHPLDGPFDHGLTRDQGARLGRGPYVVFLTQDATPASREWLARLLAPLLADPSVAAVQGGIEERPEAPPFFWHSNGPRFYFTAESERWIRRHRGIGLSSVNLALRRTAWARLPFGPAAILEDKKWQQAAASRGLRIVAAPEAAVHHSHQYTLGSLVRRCQDEGFGWRGVGERYGVGDLVRDTLSPGKYLTLARGLWRRQVRSGAEVAFPFVRPWLVFKGNRFNQRLR